MSNNRRTELVGVAHWPKDAATLHAVAALDGLAMPAAAPATAPAAAEMFWLPLLPPVCAEISWPATAPMMPPITAPALPDSPPTVMRVTVPQFWQVLP